MLGNNSNTLKRKRRAISTVIALLILFVAQTFLGNAALAQTKEPPAGANAQGQQVPQGSGSQMESTVPNPYEDADAQMKAVTQAAQENQQNINKGVEQLLTRDRDQMTGEYSYAPLVFQAAEQGAGSQIQQAANNISSSSLGSINETYRGLHQWFKDDMVGNLFSNIGQLIGKWLSELINGWLADTAQFLAKFLRVFVLNPNIATNGLNGGQDDGISYYVREGADIMYGIAIDLMLLLFILCIWKYWAEAAWRGAGNLMGSVGRLIFTSGLMLAWPTLYAFEIQITNEMIKEIYFNSSDQVMMLDSALAAAVKGGVIAAGAGATSVFAPLLANLALPVAGGLVGSAFYFASLIIFTILGGMLIAELVYILILKAIQTALLTAQYMFAPIFLVFFAIPDTENVATGFVRAFVETSLWTFVWVGLLKVMVIILFSDFNPWGKILISVGVLQLMIQVPSFLARAQISPMSDFVTAGLITGGALKMLGGLGGALSSFTDKGINWWTNDRFNDRGLQQTKDSTLNSLAHTTQNPELLNGLNKASADGRSRNKSGVPDPSLALTPPIKTPGGEAQASPILGPDGLPLHKDMDKSLADASKAGAAATNPATGTAAATTGLAAAGTGTGTPGATTGTLAVPAPKGPGPKPGAGLTTAAGAALAGGALAGAQTGRVGSPQVEMPKDGADSGDGKLTYQFAKQTPGGWDEKYLVNVDTRKLIGKLTSVDGVGLRVGQPNTGLLGSANHGVQRINIGQGANDAEMAHAIYAGAFADNVAHDDPAKDAARKSVIASGAARPKGAMENMAANWLSNNGSSWNRTAMAKERFQQAMFNEAAVGSQAYVSGQKGNAYTDYLRTRYGEWGPDQDAMAVHLITNPDSSESPWNRNVGPAAETLISNGIPIGADTRGAAQNMSIQAMHPARRKQAIFAALSYTHDEARATYGNEHPSVFTLAHGEMAKSLSAEEVNGALAIYQVSGQSDLNPTAVGYSTSLAADTGKDVGTSYACLATAAPYVAQKLGRISQSANLGSIHTIADLQQVILPAQGESTSSAIQYVMESTSAILKNGEAHGIPMRTVMNADVAQGAFEFIGSDIGGNLNTPRANTKMQIVARNANLAVTPNDVHTLNAILDFVDSGGSVSNLNSEQVIQARARYVENGAQSIPHMAQIVDMDIASRAAGVSELPDLKQMANYVQPYVDGVEKDIRQAAVVMTRMANNIPAGRDANQLILEVEHANGGSFNAGMYHAIARVNGVVKNAATSAGVFELTAKAMAAEQGINAAGMNVGQILGEIEKSPAYQEVGGANAVADRIIDIQRKGGFSGHQLQDSTTVELIMQDYNNASPQQLQAINVVTHMVGSSGASANPQYISATTEYLSNSKPGSMRDVNGDTIRAAAALAEARAAADQPQAQDIKLNQFTLRMVMQDPAWQQNRQVGTDVIDKIIQANTNRNNGGGP